MRRRRNQYKIKKTRTRRSFGGGLNFNRQKKSVNKVLLREILSWTGEIILTIVLAGMLVFAFGGRVPVVGQSMSGTLESGQVVLVNRISYKLMQPKANDIIVFLPNGNEKSHYYIKRVIAVPGDTVQIIDGTVYVNEEPFEETIENPYIENGLLAEEPIIVGEDEYFVLADFRNGGADSRFFGPVKAEEIQGVVITILRRNNL